MPEILTYNGKAPKISPTAFIASNAVIIGDVEIGDEASVWYNCVIRGDVNYIRIGKRTNIQDGTIIHVHRNNAPTIIGDGVTVGHKAMLHGCVIEDSAFIGMCSTIMDNAIVKSGGMVGAAAFVGPNKVVNTGELWLGVPARKIRELSEEEVAYIRISEDNYVKLGAAYQSHSFKLS